MSMTAPSKAAKHELRQAIAGQWKNAIPVNDGKYIVGVVKKSGNLIVAVTGNFDRRAYKAVVAEAIQLGLTLKKMVVYCDLAPYTGSDIDVVLYADSGIDTGAAP